MRTVVPYTAAAAAMNATPRRRAAVDGFVQYAWPWPLVISQRLTG